MKQLATHDVKPLDALHEQSSYESWNATPSTQSLGTVMTPLYVIRNDLPTSTGNQPGGIVTVSETD